MIRVPTVPSLRRLCLLCLVLLAVVPAAALAGRDEPKVYTLLPASGNPEGVAYDKKRGFFYVSVVTDGSIYRGTLDDPTVRPWLPAGQDGRTSATGMKVEGRLLYVAGASTGAIFVYDTRTGSLVGRFDTGPGGFINDLALTKNGDVYATDSLRPFLYRVRAESVEAGAGPVEAIPILPEIPHVPGQFNLNGIDVSENGKELITIQTNTGRVWKIVPGGRSHGGDDDHGDDDDRRSGGDPLARTITEIPVRGGPLVNGDGLIVDGDRLLVVQNQQELITEVKLSRQRTRGEVVGTTTDPTFKTPTTAAIARNRLLVVNSEFFETDGPPYTVTSIRTP
jgi:sugar lactone lactonase YvrE